MMSRSHLKTEASTKLSHKPGSLLKNSWGTTLGVVLVTCERPKWRQSGAHVGEGLCSGASVGPEADYFNRLERL
jgi:hypothetical protein